MPLQQCVTNKGKAGWRFGKHGKCYPGKSGKARAKAQMRAMIANGYKPKGHKK